MTEITGECFCGDIKYEIEPPLGEARSCHCSRCRKAFSGAGSAVVFVNPEHFRWVQGEDQLSTYMSMKNAGLGFCRRCGTTLCGIIDGRVALVTLGTLNGDPGITLSKHIFVGSKAGWDEIGGTAPQHDTWPDPNRS